MDDWCPSGCVDVVLHPSMDINSLLKIVMVAVLGTGSRSIALELEPQKIHEGNSGRGSHVSINTLPTKINYLYELSDPV